MYPNARFRDDEGMLSALAGSAQFAHLVTFAQDEFWATALPMLIDREADDVWLRGHVVRTNPHADQHGSPALVVISGPDSYVSPSWYPSKAEHGKVVPTWNYEVVHAHGRLVVHDDAAWVRGIVTRLTEYFEATRDDPWAVTDAPPEFVDAQLRSIVGVEVRVERWEGRRKLSQNRSAADREGARRGLQESGHRSAAVASAMASASGD